MRRTFDGAGTEERSNGSVNWRRNQQWRTDFHLVVSLTIAVSPQHRHHRLPHLRSGALGAAAAYTAVAATTTAIGVVTAVATATVVAYIAGVHAVVAAVAQHLVVHSLSAQAAGAAQRPVTGIGAASRCGGESATTGEGTQHDAGEGRVLAELRAHTIVAITITATAPASTAAEVPAGALGVPAAVAVMGVAAGMDTAGVSTSTSAVRCVVVVAEEIVLLGVEVPELALHLDFVAVAAAWVQDAVRRAYRKCSAEHKINEWLERAS